MFQPTTALYRTGRQLKVLAVDRILNLNSSMSRTCSLKEINPAPIKSGRRQGMSRSSSASVAKLAWFFSLGACTLAVQLKGGQAPLGSYPPQMDGVKTEVYKTIGDVELKLYVFDAKGHSASDRLPAIVFFFGSGFRFGTPQQFEPQCRYFASRGMVAITADYRVSSRQRVKAPEEVGDAKSAIRWVRQNASHLGIDPSHIVAGGGSAGGYLAAVTGIFGGLDEPRESLTVSSRPNALVLFNPVLIMGPVPDSQVIDQEGWRKVQEKAPCPN